MKYDSLDHWYKKGVVEGKKSTKFRKGACQNCGAMTHKQKDCLEVGGACTECATIATIQGMNLGYRMSYLK